MLGEIMRYRELGATFGFETTLSGTTLLHTVSRLRTLNYQVHLFYLWVSSPEISLKRIAERVREGGHNIPETVVRRRYERSGRNFLTRYRGNCNSWLLFDNSAEDPAILAHNTDGNTTIIKAAEYENLLRLYGSR